MTTANPHLRAILIAGLLAAAAVALGLYTLERQQVSSQAPPPVVRPHHRRTVAAPKPAPARPAAKPQAHVAARPAPKAKVKAKPAPRVDPVVRAALAAGLPRPVARAFAGHDVVVASLYASDSAVDRQAEAEARAGAALAGAGFAPIDAAREGASGQLTKQLGLLDTPTVLVYRRPDFALFAELQGFADRETVGQAALNADPTPGGGPAQTSWARQAGALCRSASAGLGALGPLGSAADLKSAAPQVHRIAQAFLAGLAALEPTAGQAADAKRFLAVETENMRLTEQLVAAGAKHDATAAATLGAKQATADRQANALALKLGATSCAGAF